MSDEANFHMNGYVNKQIYLFWPNENRYIIIISNNTRYNNNTRISLKMLMDQHYSYRKNLQGYVEKIFIAST